MSLLASVGSKVAVKSAGDALNKIAGVIDFMGKADAYAGTSSLARITSMARVEPLCIVDSDCVHLEYISDVLQSLQSIFSGYYLQAVSLMTNVAGVSVAKQLDILNPNRNPDVVGFINGLAEVVESKESYTGSVHDLPYKLSAENYKWKLPTSKNAISLENKRDRELHQIPIQERTTKDYLKHLDSKEYAKIEDKALLSTTELSNLSVGKLINVTVQHGTESATIPIAIRLIVNEMRPNTIVELFGKGKVEKSFTERYYKWKAGRISFFNDLIFCKDLLREHKKTLMQDKEGVYSDIQNRANKNRLAGLMSKRPSVATSSNLYVISSDTAAAIRRTSGVDLTNFGQRQKLFEETYAMILVIIDREYQRINFYHDGISKPTSVGLRDIKASNKDSGPSIMDVLSAYKQGQAPVL